MHHNRYGWDNQYDYPIYIYMRLFKITMHNLIKVFKFFNKVGKYIDIENIMGE